jgi:GT2 family glycosyltransferase
MPNSVSLVIVNYNAGDYLVACISSALSQVDDLVVVDNASTDSSLAQIEAVFSGESKLRIVRNRENLGFAAACNIGARSSAGSYLFFLNPDCVLEPDSVSYLLQALEVYPEAGMVGGLLVNPDGTEQGGGRRAIPTPGRSFARAFGLSRFANRWPHLFLDFYLHKQPLPSAPIEIEAISGACILVRRAVFDDVGLWDEGYFLHCEDLDLSMALRQKGWKIMFVPDARIVHRNGGCSRSRPVFVEWHKHRGMIRFYFKFFRHQYPGVLMWMVICGVWLRFAAVAAYHTGRSVGRWLRLGRE